MEAVVDPIERVLAFLARFVSLDEGERKLVRMLSRIERYPRGTRLLAEGEVARETWLVIEGCLRVFRRVDGAERTVALHTEFHVALPPTYGTPAPSPVTFECLDDVVAIATTREEEMRGLTEYPAFESVCRVMGDVWMARMQETHIDAMTRTAKERYLDLVTRRPELLQRVPQYHIASLLGIQPETLSRIRRELARGPAGR